jgi:hypothetical protein
MSGRIRSLSRVVQRRTAKGMTYQSEQRGYWKGVKAYGFA